MKKPEIKVSKTLLAQELAHLVGITPSTARRLINTISSLVLTHLLEGKAVDIGVGRLYGVYQRARPGSHPKTYERITLKEGVRLRVSPSVSTKRLLSSCVDTFKPKETTEETTTQAND